MEGKVLITVIISFLAGLLLGNLFNTIGEEPTPWAIAVFVSTIVAGVIFMATYSLMFYDE